MNDDKLTAERKAFIEKAENYLESRRAIRRGPVGYRKVYRYKPNGAAELARRCAQINAGQLRVQNGLEETFHSVMATIGQ